VEQRSEEWKAFRRNKIGASDAPIIMGVSPYKTPLQLWEEKVLERDDKENASMKFGNENEAHILKLVEKKFGKKFKPQVLQSSLYGWQIASLDGISKDKTVIEIKCNNEEAHGMVAQGKCPDKYFPQIQHQAFVAGVQSVINISFHKDDLQYLEIGADETYQDDLLAKESEFWERMVNFDPPPATDRDLVCMDHNEAFMQKMASISEWAEEARKLKELIDAGKKELISQSSGRSITTRLGKMTRYLERGRIDYEAIPELQGVDLNKFRKAAFEKWRFSFSD
jgi:putative phage-type endonuclease